MADLKLPDTIAALVSLGIVPEHEARTASEVATAQGINPLQMLHTQGRINDTDVVRATCSANNITFYNLVDFDIDTATLSLISGDVARRGTLIPLTDIDGVLTVAVPHKQVGDLLLRDDLERRTRRRVTFVVAMREDITAKINRLYRAEAELTELAHGFDERSARPVDRATADLSSLGEADASEGPVVKFANRLIEQAITDGASDIHIDPTEQGLTVRFRIDGVLKVSSHQPKSMLGPLISRLKIMANMDIAEKRNAQGGRISFPFKGKKIDLRAVALPTIHDYEKIVLRVLDTSAVSLSLHAQGFSDDNLRRFEAAYKQPSGLVLVTGQTGAGKSTTLYSAIQDVADPSISIITAEDPVERIIPGIAQIQTNDKAGLTFSNILREILRSDPQVILVGEIRDEETARLAIRGALTGHLVLSTIHANDASSTITRLLDMGIEPFLVASAVKAAVAQALVRRLCLNCREPHTLTEAEIAVLPEFPWNPGQPLPTIYAPKEGGCNSCSDTGYRGRIAIHEVMAVTSEIARLTVDKAPAEEIDRMANEQGMASLAHDAWTKVLSGITSVDEVLRIVV